MDRKYISYSDLKEEFRDNYHVRVLVSFHNVLAYYDGVCQDCCAHDRDHCIDCSTTKTIRGVEETMNDYAQFMENSYPEFKGKLMKKYFDQVHVDDELTGLLRRKRRFGDSIYGLKDKNGKPIRDGEIVETKYGRICKVGFMHNDGFCGYDLTPFDKIDCKAPDDYDMWASNNLTVVSDQYPYEEE